MQKQKPAAPPGAATRKSSPPIKVYCLPEEKEAIQRKADNAGLSASSYLLNLGMGYEIQSTIDSQLILELAKVNADQGRLGGLLKLWLSNDDRFLGFDEARTRATILAVLSKIEAMQDALLKLADRE